MLTVLNIVMVLQLQTGRGAIVLKGKIDEDAHQCVNACFHIGEERPGAQMCDHPFKGMISSS